MQKTLPYHLRVALTLASLLLTGLLSGCDSGGPTYPSVVPDDALEPNNTREEATEIELDYQADLVLQDQDKDWFKFTLAEGKFIEVTMKAPDAQFWDVLMEIYSDTQFVRTLHLNVDANASGYEYLPAGDYSLKLSGHITSNTRKYSVKVSAKALPDAAYEPNNTSQTASKIELNAGAQGMFLGGGDEDWYTFTLDETQIVTISLDEGAGAGYTTFDRALYNSKLEVYNNSKGEYGDGYWETLTAGLEPGTYYIRAYREQEFDAGSPYSLSVSSVPIPDKAFEPNDASRTATPVELNAEAREMFLGAKDEDWYTFTLDEAQIVTIELEENQDYYGFDRVLYNSDFEVYDDDDYGNIGFWKTFTIGLEPDTYYIRAYREREFVSSGVLYSLSVSGKPVPDKAYEPNNSFGQASAITLPFKDDFFIYKGDEDWFTFSLPTEQLVTFDRKDDASHQSLAAIIYKESGDKVQDFRLRGSRASSFVLPAGAYRFSLGMLPTDDLYGDPRNDKSFAYSLIVTSENLPKPDFEPNNSLQQAHPISLGFSADALLVSDGDDDWFTFTLNTTKQVIIAFKEYGNGLPYAYLADANGNNIQNVEGGSISPVLKAGTYGIKVSDGSSNTSIKYGLSVKEK